jgi:hypothetical protein
MVKAIIISSFLLSPLFAGCSLLFKNAKVAVDNDYQGWCFIIPVKDTNAAVFDVLNDDTYRMNKDGVIYIPEHLISKGKDLHIDIYRDGKEISEDVRYFRLVETSSTNNNIRLHYFSFYLPHRDELKYKDDDIYWREKNDYRDEGRKRFNALLKDGGIIFK